MSGVKNTLRLVYYSSFLYTSVVSYGHLYSVRMRPTDASYGIIVLIGFFSIARREREREKEREKKREKERERKRKREKKREERERERERKRERKEERKRKKNKEK